MSVRLCKVALTAAIAFYFSLVVLNNLTDYGTNLAFVQHVLSMDTVRSERIRWRALTHPAVHHAFYGCIIAWEAAAAGLCWWGAFRMLRARRADAATFLRATATASIGLTVGCLLWFSAFMSVGGEWFAMWMSRMSGMEPAFRMFTINGIVLLLLQQREPE